MQIKHVCYFCKGSCHFPLNDPYSPPSDITCPYCEGVGYSTTDIIGDELTDMQADITKCLRRLKKIMDKLEIGDD